METYKVKPGDKAIYPDGTVHMFVKFGEVMTEPKKNPPTKPLTKQLVEEFLFSLRDRADAQSRIIDELRRAANTDAQSMARMVDRLSALENAMTSMRVLRIHQVADMENRIRKLEQQHCNHDYEIVGGCIGEHRTVKVKCVHCGLTGGRLLDVAEEPKKLNWFKRFVNYMCPFSSPFRW